jgi:ribosomal protein S12
LFRLDYAANRLSLTIPDDGNIIASKDIFILLRERVAVELPGIRLVVAINQQDSAESGLETSGHVEG